MCSDRLPDKIHGWTMGQDDQVYNRENLYDYIDGGAELYLSYGFKDVRSRTYVCTGQPDIIVDVFDMGNSYNAFGIYSHSREVLDRAVGQGSHYTTGLLLFWKDWYFVSILASPETAAAKEAMYELAHHISNSIHDEGPLPEILKLLPEIGLIEESIRYFRHHSWLNSFYFIAQENILLINDQTDVVLAKYGTPENHYFLLLIKYLSADDAIKAHHSFIKNYLPELSIEPIVQIEDGRWSGCLRSGTYLIAIFNSPDREKASQLIGETRKRIEIP